jgi:serine protease Do
VLAVDGEKVGTLEAFYQELWARPEPESAVQLTVLHGTELLELTVHAVDRLKTMRKPAGI